MGTKDRRSTCDTMEALLESTHGKTQDLLGGSSVRDLHQHILTLAGPSEIVSVLRGLDFDKKQTVRGPETWTLNGTHAAYQIDTWALRMTSSQKSSFQTTPRPSMQKSTGFGALFSNCNICFNAHGDEESARSCVTGAKHEARLTESLLLVPRLEFITAVSQVSLLTILN